MLIIPLIIIFAYLLGIIKKCTEYAKSYTRCIANKKMEEFIDKTMELTPKLENLWNKYPNVDEEFEKFYRLINRR